MFQDTIAISFLYFPKLKPPHPDERPERPVPKKPVRPEELPEDRATRAVGTGSRLELVSSQPKADQMT